jgi:hypothetical protein
MPDILSDAKNALAHANSAFPTPVAAAQAPQPVAAAKAVPAPSIGQELAAKKIMADKARSALPKLHKGGPVPEDGAYQLKAGEHVLTAPEAAKAAKAAKAKAAKKSVPLVSGIKSLSAPGKHIVTVKGK